jgi:hypothetical protein
VKFSKNPTFGDAFDFSGLKADLARRQADAAEITRLVEEAERAKQAEIAEAAKQIAVAEAARGIEHAEAARRKELHAYIRGRGVTAVGHFTRLSNLESILKHGLLPRARLEEMNAVYAANDALRLDDVNGICLSISFPNYKLFYKFRNEYPREEWVLLVLSTEVIEGKGCIFNPHNAASNAMTRHSTERRMQIDALQAMFYDQAIEVDGALSERRPMLREYLGLPDHFTTDPQAEIIVTESIEPSLIREIIFNRDDTRQNREILNQSFHKFGWGWNGTIRLLPDAGGFGPRLDYKYWRNSND